MNGSSGAQSFGELFGLFTSEELQRTRQEAALLLIDSLLSGHCSTPFVDESVYWKSLLAQPLSTSAFPSRPMGPIQQQPMPPPPMEEPAYSLQPLMPVSALPVMMEPNCVQALRADEEAPPAPVEHPSPAHSSAGSSSNFSAATSPSISPNLLAKRSQSPASPVCAEAKRCEWHDCSRIFDTQEAFLEHMRLDHLAELSLAASHCPRAIVCRWRRCERGQKPFGAVYMLCQHLRAHTGEKPYHCEVPNCGKRYSRLENLKTHQRKHSGEKPYRCAFCVRSFTNASDKAKHEVRVHVNKEKKQYPCTVGGCDCAYTDPSSLRKHTLACHGQACWLEHKARRQVVRRHSQNQQQQPEQ